MRGPARVALGPEDFGRIRPGDIIVCPSSNPSWVPVFAIAGGLVTNTGGVICHAAVVAREFGLPAVVGTDATELVADGRGSRSTAARGHRPPVVTSEAPSDADRGAMLSALMLGVACGAILVPLNTTMLAVALPGIMGEFGLGANEVASVVTLYLAAVAVALPVAGSLGDRFGHRSTFLAGVLGSGSRRCSRRSPRRSRSSRAPACSRP